MPGTTPENGDLLQVRTVCYTDNQISMNVLHYQMVTQGVAPITLENMAEALSELWAPLYKSLMPDSAAFRGVSVQNLMSPRTLEYHETGDSGPGTEGANLAPTQATGLIRFRAPLAGRRYRGRIYPGLISAGLIAANGGLSVGGETALNALATELGPARTVAEDGQTALLGLAIRHPDVIVAGVRIPQWSTVDLIDPSVLLATQKRRGEYGQHNVIPW